MDMAVVKEAVVEAMEKVLGQKSTRDYIPKVKSLQRQWIEREIAALRAKRDELSLIVDSPEYDHKKHYSKLQDRTKIVLRIAWLYSFDSQLECWEEIEKMTPETVEVSGERQGESDATTEVRVLPAVAGDGVSGGSSHEELPQVPAVSGEGQAEPEAGPGAACCG